MQNDCLYIFFNNATVAAITAVLIASLIAVWQYRYQKNIDRELDKWERGEWQPEDHRASMDEVMRKIKSQYQFKEDDLL
jgi:hypothetical protein